MPTFTFQGRIDTLEIARGHDGLLGGRPEPVLVVGLYVTNGTTTRMLGRSLHRFHAVKPFPSRAAADDYALPSWALDVDGAFQFVALAAALEQDGGVDVQRIFGAVEHHAMLTLYASEAREVEPMPIGGPFPASWSAPTPVELVIDGAAASTSCRSDKWVGAVCWTMHARPGAPVSTYRLPFLSVDRKNDWTAIVAVAH